MKLPTGTPSRVASSLREGATGPKRGTRCAEQRIFDLSSGASSGCHGHRLAQPTFTIKTAAAVLHWSLFTAHSRAPRRGTGTSTSSVGATAWLAYDSVNHG